MPFISPLRICFAFGNIISPLVVYSMKKNEYAFVADQGRESLNFQLSMLFYTFLSLVLIFFGLGILFILLIPVLALILTVVAAVRANDGEYYRYPFCIHFIK